jgi:hypothetical protein
MVQIPTLNGTVTETNTGLLRGWGTIQKSGILQINGQVVADGSGIDRTLDLRTFSAVETASNLPPATASASIAMPSVISPSTGSSTSVSGASRVTTTSFASSLTMAAVGASDGTTLTDTTTAPLLTPGAILPPSNGIYAVNHGRVCLSLQPSSTDSSVLTWGENPNAPVLKLTNSVRIALTSDGTSLDDPTLTQLALLAPDRTDAPKLSEITGTTIGLWKVGDTGGEISNANLTISYDSLLANALGATQDSVQLWTLNVPSDSWELVTPDSFALDTADHLVYGSAEDFSYFAVSAIPSPDANVEFIRAHQLAVINGAPGIAAGSSSPSSSVPEPTGLGLLAAASAGLLGRRRRRVVLQSN